MTNGEPHSHRAPMITAVLWLAFFMAPAAWAIHLQFVYAASQQVCKGTLSLFTLHAVSMVCVVAALVSFAVAAWQLFATGATWPSDESNDQVARRRFLAAEALLAGLLFSIVIVAQWLALIYLSPCAP
jgi:uncharacterized membrane protein